MQLRFVLWSVLVACSSSVPGSGDTGATPPVPPTTVSTDSGSPPDETGDPTSPTPTGDALVRDTLVAPHRDGVTLFDLDGGIRFARSFVDLFGACNCGGEGASPDGDGLLVSFTTAGAGPGPGAIVRLDADGEVDFRVDGFGFPHDVIRDPADGSIIVVATNNNELRWIPGDGSSNLALRSLSSTDPEFPRTPNGAERLDIDGRTYLLVSHRPGTQGRITMWDITDEEPTFVWRFPSTGQVSIPHAPILREVDDEWWLLWAHTAGQSFNRGTVGLAVTSDPTVAPTYVADLVPGEGVGPFTFFRGVELLSDGTMILTDSGGMGDAPGRIFAATFPDLEPPLTGENGAVGSRVYVDLGEATLLDSSLRSPFEAWYWAP